MGSLALTEVVAIWGAGLSTLLASVRLFELWKDRQRLETSYRFTGSPEIGNEIIIRNLSSKPLGIIHWELQFCKRSRLKWRPVRVEEPDEFGDEFQISGYSREVLSFCDGDWFPWGTALEGTRIYLKLHITGKRGPTRLLVWKPHA